MTRTISATEARVHFGEVLRKVAEEQATYIVERGGEPRAVVISFEEFQRLSPQKMGEFPGWWQEILEVREQVGRELAGKPVLDENELIDEGRQERDDALLDDLLRREHRDPVGKPKRG